MSKTTSTALAIVPAAGGDVESLVAALGGSSGKQEFLSSRVNLLFPFVPRHAFESTAAALAPLLAKFPPLSVALSTDITICQSGKAWLAQLEIETMVDMLVALQLVCEDGAPGCTDLGDRVGGFKAVLTVGSFESREAAEAAVQSAPWNGGELLVDRVTLLHRRHQRDVAAAAASGAAPFQPILTVGLGPEAQVVAIPASTTALSSLQDAVIEGQTPLCEPTYQVGKGMVRLSFELPSGPSSTKMTSQDKMLFVVDHSYSMIDAYDQVKKAVTHMLDSATGDSEPDFILYSTEAKFATAREVLQSKVTCATSFENAFKKIQEYVQRQPIEATVRVVFMTDGADTASKNLRLAIQLFQAFLNSCKRHVILHTLGFTTQHNRCFLEELRTMGATEGVYRYAEADGLDSSFTELFDFFETTAVRAFTAGGVSFSSNPTRLSNSALLFDEMVPVDAAGTAFDGMSDVLVTMASGEAIVLHSQPPDILFSIKCIEEAEIRSMMDLNRLQSDLSAVMDGTRVPKAQRIAIHEARMVVQEKLDQFHELFADVARGVATGDGITARLNSLRHEAKFCKARRAREMNKRAAKNADRSNSINAQLRALPHPPPGAMATLGQDLTCMLSGDTIDEVMFDSHDDVMVFSVRVLRPEHAIDAPTQVQLKSICVGAYSNQAFISTAGYSIARAGAQSAHGGFADRGVTELEDDVGLFLAADGQRMNGCLPLYLNEHHWKRVEVMLEPMLGYFFTLDPLGYKGDQLIALFGLLGQALALQASGEWVNSDWADFLLTDMTKLCKAVLPKALQYLAAGSYTGCARGDLVEEFIASPAGRTKEKTPSLFVIVGWAHVTGAAVDCSRFRMAFTEELCRRTLGYRYKGQAELAAELLEQLVYGPAAPPNAIEREASEALSGSDNSAAAEARFAEYAAYKLGQLGKKRAAVLRKRYQKMGPPTAENLLDPAEGFRERPIADYTEHAEFMDGLVEAVLAKVAKSCGSIGVLYDNAALATGIDGEHKRLMLIQAMQYCTNDAVNYAVSHGQYLETFDVIGDKAAVKCMASALHTRLEQRREENWAASVRERNELLTAKRIACSENPAAMAGRLIAACPTRGGGVFERLVGLLASGEVDGTPIPLLCRKVRAVLTGRVRLADGAEVMDVMSNGESWVNCPIAVAEQFAEIIGEDAFLKIEIDMRGFWGHVYRESDLPNRHGYCNSHPNPRLSRQFKGFALNAGAAKARSIAKAA